MGYPKGLDVEAGIVENFQLGFSSSPLHLTQG